MRWFAVLLIGALVLTLTWWKTGQHGPAYQQAAEVQATPVVDDAPAITPGNQTSLRVLPSAPVDTAAIAAGRAAQKTAVDGIVEAGRRKLTAQYQAERIDGSWAIAREDSLLANGTSPQIEALNAQPANLVAHCRTSVCRVEANFATQQIANDWLTLYSTNQGVHLSSATYDMTPNPDNTVHLEIYGLAR